MDITPATEPPPSRPLYPSGRQTVLDHGDQRLVVVEVGGGIRSWSVGDWEVIDGYPATEMCTSGRGQLLVPWPNRLGGGSYEFAGETLQVPLTEPEAGNAIHGLARFARWDVAEQGAGTATLCHRLPAQPGYPWTLDLAVRYRLSDDGVEVTMSACNRASTPCPFGAGAHPYVTLGGAKVDDMVLRSPAAVRFVTDDRSLPVGTEPVDGTPYDFRSPRPIGDTELDTAFTGLHRGPDGRAEVELSSGQGGRRVKVWLGPECDYLMLFTGDSLPDPSRRRQGLGVEPMTCAPDAFRTGQGTWVLQPGQSASATWGMTASL